MDKLLNKLPREFIERIKKIYPADFSKILRSFLVEKKPTFRTNLVKIQTQDLATRLQSQNIVTKRVDWYKDAFVLIRPKAREFQKNTLYKDGFVYFQNLSSMLPVLLLSPGQNEKILDLCAAPGSKTTQIVSDSRGKSLIVAVEKVSVRLYKLLANLKLQGAVSVKTELGDGAKTWKKYPEYFDKVLVDAPCSCEGNFFVHNPRTYSYWSLRKIKESKHKQKRLLFSGIKSLKAGGVLIYSTCTFSPEENEEVIQWALDKFADKIYLEKISFKLSNIKPGLLQWKGKEFSKVLKLTKRIIPTDTMQAFFIGCLRKR